MYPLGAMLVDCHERGRKPEDKKSAGLTDLHSFKHINMI